jgi:mono/diheme cytochrome c family protein
MNHKARMRKIRVRNMIVAASGIFVLLSSLKACSLSEEIKQIKASEQYEERQGASRSTDLTGEQIFIRSCNTCHPGGREGLGPSLVDIDKKFPDDTALKSFIRKGKGIMPGQPATVINDTELDHLVTYVRNL